MSIHLGVDIGGVSIKLALLLDGEDAAALASSDVAKLGFRRLALPQDADSLLLISPYRRTKARPTQVLRQALVEVAQAFPARGIDGLMITGSAGELPARTLALPRCNEFQALVRAVDALCPQARTVFEIGGESSKYLRLDPDPGSGRLSIADYGTNGDCAAGTGSFLDQQAGRLKFAVEDIGRIAGEATRTAQVAGRCSVFAKSDMIHAQQKGFVPAEVLKGLCKAVAINYKSAVVKGRIPQAPVLLTGGVSANAAVVEELRAAFGLDAESLTVPEAAESFPAIGAAVLAQRTPLPTALDAMELANRIGPVESPDAAMDTATPTVQADQKCDSVQPATSIEDSFATSPPLTLDRVQLLRDRVRPYDFTGKGELVDAYLGIDIGSVGTKLAVIDSAGEVIHAIFARTEGRPIQVVSRILGELRDAVGDRICIRGVGTTGSGRELIGELVGADSINDEITCHKTGATFIGDRLLGRRPDTIFEIGGQDSKYISLQTEKSSGDQQELAAEQGSTAARSDTIVVDFTMNEACAAGTGSFLEERAEELGVAIKGEFSREAFSSRGPIKLGERCTVFMERDVNAYMQRGARREDVIAGLAYSVVYNYINRVVRGRPIGDCVFFQGGTAYNDAVAAAFSIVTGKQIIVPPHNAVLGAIGAAMLAQEKITHTEGLTSFRGYDLTQVDYSLREFTCHGCGNSCTMQEFKVEDAKTYWGDKCSDRYRKRAKVDHVPAIPDLVALRRELLMADDTGDPAEAGVTIGIPLAMYTYDLLPFYRRFWRDCGFKVLLSAETNNQIVRQGYDCVVAEPCFPIIVAHGHVADLVKKNVDYIWLPNVLSAETKFLDNESHVCPWGQTLPFVIRQASAFRAWQERILCPTLEFRRGVAGVRDAMIEAAMDMDVDRKRAERAFDAAAEALARFRTAYSRAGTEALAMLERTGETGIVLVGRPYNLHDPGVSLSVARKLRENYGVNLLPIDALPLADIDIRDLNDNMFWEYGRRILAACRLVAQHPNLHIVYVTNFKCGPDSFVKSFVRPASGKPFLTLQFDGHSNDAGMMTRCEAYLDSKGILRWWRKQQTTGQASTAAGSTSRKWPTPAPDSWPPRSVPSASTRTPRQTPMPRH